ncbi:Flagellar basal-body rod protein FlgC [Andreprevotia sp. IGB-42]|uniref:flagellar basal body rod protein FlgC n=1 Tax=Andreprevotia sp. IGB-42 TaxID=2497473 RepID=UPI00135CE66E|nr:flagellar basal body rod protein FlgC [Andreprevotia sp. IGB-42]KAF0813398.1 Flagellar basal-body rod protein FlgC [Andreprevotia sp. IGB-42]
MDYLSAFAISAAGMRVEKMRLDVTALNLANMNSTRGADGQLYQPLRVVASAATSFDGHFSQAAQLQAMLPQGQIEPLDVAPRKVHDPGHPAADAAGDVEMPAINHLGEMLNMATALRAYEANVVAMNAAKTMALRALEIGGGA